VAGPSPVGFHCKKKRLCPLSKSGLRPARFWDVEARKTWPRRVARKKLGRLIVLDETAFTTNMHTACGYAPKGGRLTVF